MAQTGVAENVTEYTLDSVQGIVLELVGIVEDPKTKPMEKIRAMREIAELRGYKIDRSIKNIRNLSYEELHGAIRELVIPTLAPFGLKSGQKELILDSGDETPT